MELIGMGAAIGAGIAVAVAGMGVALGQGKIGAAAMEGIARNPEAEKKISSKMMIAMGMTESAAIYGLIIAGALSFIAFTAMQ